MYTESPFGDVTIPESFLDIGIYSIVNFSIL